MNANYIKPIPKKIEKRILAYDAKHADHKGLRFYAYLTTIRKELVKITVAVRNKGKRERLIKQVAIHGVYSDQCLVRDIEYNYIGGYRVGWFAEGIKYPYNLPPYYNDGKWYAVEYKYFNPWAPVINPKFAVTLPQFRYSAVDIQDPPCIVTYLRTYLKYPQLEYLVKAGLGKFADSKLILEKIGQDKAFRRWLMANREELIDHYYYVDVVLRAYRTGKPLATLQAYREARIKLSHDPQLKPICELFKGIEREKLLDYIAAQKTNTHTYLDYLKACQYLSIDMSLPKNRFPHDFKYWHDMRIDQYATARAEADRKAKQELYEKFSRIAEKYLPLEYAKRSAFICIIARSPADLIREGEMLNHCVGRMNYDMRVIREQSLIFFIRMKEHPDTPFVTVEYSLQSHKVLQCYGEHDHRPSDDVLHYVNKVWLPYANKTLKKLAAWEKINEKLS